MHHERSLHCADCTGPRQLGTGKGVRIVVIEPQQSGGILILSFVGARSGLCNVDPNRMVGGGFSAGANTAQNAAYAERAPRNHLISILL